MMRLLSRISGRDYYKEIVFNGKVDIHERGLRPTPRFLKISEIFMQQRHARGLANFGLQHFLLRLTLERMAQSAGTRHLSSNSWTGAAFIRYLYGDELGLVSGHKFSVSTT